MDTRFWAGPIGNASALIVLANENMFIRNDINEHLTQQAYSRFRLKSSRVQILFTDYSSAYFGSLKSICPVQKLQIPLVFSCLYLRIEQSRLILPK